MRKAYWLAKILGDDEPKKEYHIIVYVNKKGEKHFGHVPETFYNPKTAAEWAKSFHKSLLREYGTNVMSIPDEIQPGVLYDIVKNSALTAQLVIVEDME